MKKLPVILFIALFTIVSCKQSKTQKGNERILSKPEVIQGTIFSAGSSVKTDEKGLLANVILGADQKLMDISCSAAFHYIFKKGTQVEYRPSIVFEKPETPNAITIKEKHAIMGIEFPAESRFEPAVASGTVGEKKTCTVSFIQVQLGEPMTIKGKKFEAFEYLHVYSKDKIIYREKGVEKTLK